MKSLSHEWWMTFWPLTSYSDIPTNYNFHQFHNLDTELDLHRITSGFHGTFAKGVAWYQGTLTLLDTWFRPAFWDLLMLQLLIPVFLNLPCVFLDFSPWIPLGTLSILLFELVGDQSLTAPKPISNQLHQLPEGSPCGRRPVLDQSLI